MSRGEREPANSLSVPRLLRRTWPLVCSLGSAGRASRVVPPLNTYIPFEDSKVGSFGGGLFFAGISKYSAKARQDLIPVRIRFTKGTFPRGASPEEAGQ